MLVLVILQDCLCQKLLWYEVVYYFYSYMSMEMVVVVYIFGDCFVKIVFFEDVEGYVVVVLLMMYVVCLLDFWVKMGCYFVFVWEVELCELFKDCDMGVLLLVCMVYGMKMFFEEYFVQQLEVYFEVGDY